jgi:hypothetical protein
LRTWHPPIERKAQTYHYQGHSQRAIAMFSEAIGALQAMEHKTGVAYFMNLLGLARLAVNDQEGLRARTDRVCDSAPRLGTNGGSHRRLSA